MAVGIKDDVNPELDLGFILDFGGKNVENEIYKSFRHSWENQNIDVHGMALSIVMGALVEFKSKLMYNTHCYLRVGEDMPRHTDITRIGGIETHLIDFDILSNKQFDGLQTFRKKASINPKNYSGSPLTVNLRMFNMNYERYAMINRVGHFFIKGEGDINYVDTFDTSKMINVCYSHITDFKVNQLCFYNLNTDTEQVLFG